MLTGELKSQIDLRWRRFKDFAPAEMYEVVDRHAFLKAGHLASLVELDALFASLQYRAFRGEL